MIFTRRSQRPKREKCYKEKVDDTSCDASPGATTFAAPGMAKVKFDNDNHSNGRGFFVGRDGGNSFFDDRDRFDNDDGEVSFDLGIRRTRAAT